MIVNSFKHEWIYSTNLYHVIAECCFFVSQVKMSGSLAKFPKQGMVVPIYLARHGIQVPTVRPMAWVNKGGVKSYNKLQVSCHNIQTHQLNCSWWTYCKTSFVKVVVGAGQSISPSSGYLTDYAIFECLTYLN